MSSAADETMITKPSGQTLLLAAVVAASCALVGYLLLLHDPAAAAPSAAESRLALDDIPFDGAQAYRYLQELCAIGPRISASRGMHAQQKLLTDYFEKLGGKVRLQKFRVRHPLDGSPVSMANLIVEWHPEREERIMLCTHYDTRPFPDQDRRNPRGTFLGANDGASGVAILMELAHHVAQLKGNVGVDLVFFDGEEFIFRDGDPYFIGSEYFALTHAANPAAHYRYAVLLDMVGDADLQIYPDRHSMSWPDSRPLVESIFATARRLGVAEFDMDKRYDVLDDHLKLHNIGGIPSCDIIDFRFPAWHTEGDRPEACSALSLAKVGWVVQEWLDAAVKQR